LAVSEHSPACRENLLLQAAGLIVTSYVNRQKAAHASDT
jgi:hypothetical protein